MAAKDLTNIELLQILQKIDEGYIPTSEETEYISKVEELNLNRIEISTLPDSIGLLENLKGLYLNNSRIAGLPDSIGDLSKLQIFEAASTDLRYFPDSFTKLHALEFLGLHATKLTSLPDALENYPKLKKIYLSNTNVSLLPKSICFLKDLEYLSVNETKISEIPDEIGQLVSLEHLKANKTVISSLPDSICNLSNLHFLNLADTGIKKLPDDFGRLSSLESLDIHNTMITSLPQSIGSIKTLKVLNLNGTLIVSLPESLGDVAGLQRLGLRSTRVTSLPKRLALGHLPIYNSPWSEEPGIYAQASELPLVYYKSKEELTDYLLKEDMKEQTEQYYKSNQDILELLQIIDDGYTPTKNDIEWLSTRTEIYLSGSEINHLPASIGLLTSLKKLESHGTTFNSLPETICDLYNLQELDLRGSAITSLPSSIGTLKSLKVLDLWDSQIAELPESIGQLGELRTLGLSGTAIASLPETMSELRSLENLFLRGCQLSSLPEWVFDLPKLQRVDLDGTSIAELPDTLGHAISLQSLNLSRTKITRLPDSIAQLTNLQVLNVKNTRLSGLEDAIGCLSSLRSLSIGNTNISSLPETVAHLPALQSLDLCGVTLPVIPRSLALKGIPFVEKADFTYDDIGINLNETTLTEQDKSVFLETPELIPSLYQDETLITLRECKVIFLGDGDSGKSYTIKRFCNEGRKETAETPYVTSEIPGVEIFDYHVNQGEERFTIHFWDFGGQQLLHAMHRCFLTDQTCYVVTVKSRETRGTQRARYWLRNITAFAPRSPILLYVNCWDNDDGLRSIDEPRLRFEFPMIQDVVYCSAKQAEDTKFRHSIMEPVIDMVAVSEEISRKVPASWVRVRKAIEAESRVNNYLDRARYHSICEKNGIKEDQAPALLSYFNNIGVCFSYHRDWEKNELADYKLLSPVWLTNALYSIIEEGMAYTREGRISVSAIEQMLCNSAPAEIQGKEYRRIAPDIRYHKQEVAYIINVAAAFYLCYRIDNFTLFFPSLCSMDTPTDALNEQSSYPNHVEYRFSFEYLPDTVIHQLMIRFLRKGLVVRSCWMRGMILDNLDTHRAIIHAVDDNLIIDIWFKANSHVYDIFSLLRNEVISVKNSFNLSTMEFIADGTNTFPLIHLVRQYKEGVDHCWGNSTGEKYSVNELLGMFFDAETISRLDIENGQLKIAPFAYHRCNKGNAILRRAIWEAYGKKCQYCGIPLTYSEMHIDHILPVHGRHKQDNRTLLYLAELEQRGFDIKRPDYIENYFPACGKCDRLKSNSIRDVVTLREYHAIAAERTPRVIRLMERYDPRIKEENGWNIDNSEDTTDWGLAETRDNNNAEVYEVYKDLIDSEKDRQPEGNVHPNPSDELDGEGQIDVSRILPDYFEENKKTGISLDGFINHLEKSFEHLSQEKLEEFCNGYNDKLRSILSINPVSKDITKAIEKPSILELMFELYLLDEGWSEYESVHKPEEPGKKGTDNNLGSDSHESLNPGNGAESPNGATNLTCSTNALISTTEQALCQFEDWLKKSLCDQGYAVSIPEHTAISPISASLGYHVSFSISIDGILYKFCFYCQGSHENEAGNESSVQTNAAARSFLQFYTNCDKAVRQRWVFVCSSEDAAKQLPDGFMDRWNQDHDSIRAYVMLYNCAGNESNNQQPSEKSPIHSVFRAVERTDIMETEKEFQELYKRFIGMEPEDYYTAQAMQQYPFWADYQNMGITLPVNESGGNEAYSTIANDLHHLIDCSDGQCLGVFVVGEYGTGKSWLTYRLIENLTRSYHAKASPIYLELNQLRENQALASNCTDAQITDIVCDYLTSELNRGYNRTLLAQAKVPVFFLDGLDEVFSGLEASDNKIKILKEIIHYLRNNYQKANVSATFAKKRPPIFVITSRESDYKSCQLNQSFKNLSTRFRKYSLVDCSPVKIKDKLNEYAQSTGKDKLAYNSLANNQKLLEIMSRPIFFKLITDHVEDDPIFYSEMPTAVDQYDILQKVIDNALRKQRGDYSKNRQSLQKYAVDCTKRKSLKTLVETSAIKNGLSVSLLKIEPNDPQTRLVGFTHNVIREYLVAEALRDHVENYIRNSGNDSHDLLETIKASHMTEECYDWFWQGIHKKATVDIQRIQQAILGLIQSNNTKKDEILCRKLVQLLVQPGCKFSKKTENRIDLQGLRANNLYLRNCELSGINLQGSEIKNLKLVDVSLSDIDLRNADLTGLDVHTNSPIVSMTSTPLGGNACRIAILREDGKVIVYELPLRKTYYSVITICKIPEFMEDNDTPPNQIVYLDENICYIDSNSFMCSETELYNIDNYNLVHVAAESNSVSIACEQEDENSNKHIILSYTVHGSVKTQEVVNVDAKQICYLGQGKFLLLIGNTIMYLAENEQRELYPWKENYRCFTGKINRKGQLILFVYCSGCFLRIIFSEKLENVGDEAVIHLLNSNEYKKLEIMTPPAQLSAESDVDIVAVDDNSVYRVSIIEGVASTMELRSATTCRDLIIGNQSDNPEKPNNCVKDTTAYELLKMLNQASISDK